MGLTTGNYSKKTYLSIISGKFAQKVDAGTPNAVTRKIKKGKNEGQDTHELLFDKLSGQIKEMTIKRNDFGEQLEIVLSDVGEVFYVNIPVESKYFDHFCSKIGSANLNQTVEIAPYSFTPKGETTTKSGINLFQGGQKLPYFFTKEDPKGKPFPSEEKMGDREYKKWKLDERGFYCKYIMGMDKIKSAIEKPGASDLPF